MSNLPSFWPRPCINADAVATFYLAGLHRLFLEAKLAEKDHQTALQEANTRAHEMETICLDSLARHLHQLFHTDDDLFFDVYPEEWKQLQRLDFWQLSLMQEVSRIRRFIDKSGQGEPPRKLLKGSCTCNRDFMHQLTAYRLSYYRDLPGHILKSCSFSSAAGPQQYLPGHS